MHFDLKIYHPTKGVLLLRFSAADERDARRQAKGKGYTVLSVRQSYFSLRFRRAGGSFLVHLFGQELLALMDAGMGLIEALSMLARKARDPEVQQVLERVLNLIGEGQTFSNALASLPDKFPTLFVATVRASEHTGNLPEALRRYLAYYRQLNGVRDKIISASIYPTLLLAVGGMVILFLLTYVVPRFSRIYADIGEDRIPALSHLLMRWGQLVTEHAQGLLLGLVVLIAFFIYILTRPALRAAVQKTLWRLPRLGEQIKTYQLARFTRTVAMLIKGGVPLVSALDMTDELLQQPALRDGLQAAKRTIREGGALAETFRAQGLATEVGVRLLIVGERGGDLGETMERIASYYDEEIAREVEWFSRLFEPALMVFIGLLIGGIVILMYLPIFELASSIQ